jgi:hypothetical protein
LFSEGNCYIKALNSRGCILSIKLNLKPLYQRLQQAGQIQQAMALSDFLEPQDEQQQDEHEQEDPLLAIIEEYIP